MYYKNHLGLINVLINEYILSTTKYSLLFIVCIIFL